MCVGLHVYMYISAYVCMCAFMYSYVIKHVITPVCIRVRLLMYERIGLYIYKYV